MRLSQSKVGIVVSGMDYFEKYRLSAIFSLIGAMDGDEILGFGHQVIHIDFFRVSQPRVTHSSLGYLDDPDCKSVKVTLHSLEVLVAEYLEEVRLGVHQKTEL